MCVKQKKQTIMETTVNLAVEHMCSWKQLIDRMGNLWDEYQFRFHNKESIKEVLIREIKELLAFSSKEISFCQTFKEKKGRGLRELCSPYWAQQLWKSRMDKRRSSSCRWNRDSHLPKVTTSLTLTQKKDRWYSI